MSWQALEKIITLGTERTGITPDLQALVERHFPDSQLSETDRILAVLCLLSRNRKGMGKIGRQKDFEPVPIEKKGEDILSRKSVRHLDLILDGTYLQALPEFISLVADSGLHLPPESLPQLLDRCLEEGDLYPLLAPALGQRGRWLMQFNGSWKTLDPQP